MKRLFTFGCSFTKYCWPTWADFLSIEFEHFENWGIPGIGNRGILERIAECHSKNKFTKDDVVIVQWSSHLRNDYHRFDFFEDDNTDASWKTSGSIFNYMNAQKYNEQWIKEFFNEKSYVMHSLNAMVAAKNILENTGAKWIMTSMGDFQQLGKDILDPGNYKESSNNQHDLWTEYPDFLHYKSTIWENSNDWCDPIITVVLENQDKIFRWRRSPMSAELTVDPHPTPELHLEWLNMYLKPKLQIPIKKHKLHDLWILQTNELKNFMPSVTSYGMTLAQTLQNWNKEFKGH